MFSDFMPGAMALLKMIEVAASWVRSQAEPELELDSDEWPELHAPDSLPECLQENVGELLVSHYANGTIRKENPKSGVIEEECADGSLTVSLPHGKILHQRYQGESMLVLDPEGCSLVGQVGYLSIEGARSLVYHYEDASGHHIVEASSLRYFKGRRQRTPEALLPAWRAVAC